MDLTVLQDAQHLTKNKEACGFLPTGKLLMCLDQKSCWIFKIFCVAALAEFIINAVEQSLAKPDQGKWMSKLQGAAALKVWCAKIKAARDYFA